MAIPSAAAAGVPIECAIRPALVRDIPSIVDVWGGLARHHATLDRAFAPSEDWREEYRQFIRGLMGREDALAVVAEGEGRLVGYGVGRISLLPGFFEQRQRGYIHDVVTLEPYRRRGVGRRLVAALLEWMEASNVGLVELTVAVQNPEAVAFWTALGFVPYMHHLKREIG